MKNVFFLIALILTGEIANAQTFQKVTYGTVIVVSGNTALSGKIEPMKLGYNFCPNVFFATKNTYHNFMYGVGNNVAKMIHGYKPSTDFGLYVTGVKNFSTRGGYVGIGAEQFVKAGDVMCFLFCEFGTNINYLKNSQVITVGVHANIQRMLWNRKT